MSELFAAEEPSGLNKHELYKQNKQAQLMERLERRMEGTLHQLLCKPRPLHVFCQHQHSCNAPYHKGGLRFF